MKADGWIAREDGTMPASLQEIAAGLADLRGVEERIDHGVWEEAYLDPLRDILARPGKGFRARFMEHCWVLAGGDGSSFPALLGHAIELLHAGSLVIDDIEDDSQARRGRPALHRRYGLPLALNTGNLLYFLALELLGRAPVPASRRVGLFRDVSLGLLRCHQGQALDLSVRITSVRRADVPTLVDAATRLKTGSLMGIAALLGARCAGGNGETLHAVGEFGREVGVGLQMLDDWSGIHLDSRREKGIEDIRLARATWPWAWLAESTDELTYADTARQARTLSIDWQADRVRERLRSMLAATAPARIRAQLDGAVRGLRLALGGSADLAALQREIDALVEAFEAG